MQGTLAPMAIWYRGDADVFSLLFADYEGTDVRQHEFMIFSDAQNYLLLSRIIIRGTFHIVKFE